MDENASTEERLIELKELVEHLTRRIDSLECVLTVLRDALCDWPEPGFRITRNR